MEKRAKSLAAILLAAVLLAAAAVLCVYAAAAARSGAAVETVQAESLPKPEAKAPTKKTQCELCGKEAYAIETLSELAYVVETDAKGGGGSRN